jgi:hypothetical protein
MNQKEYDWSGDGPDNSRRADSEERTISGEDNRRDEVGKISCTPTSTSHCDPKVNFRSPGWGASEDNDPLDQAENIINTIQEFAKAMADLWAEFQRMRRGPRVENDDKLYHCIGHCRAAAEGPGGIVASVVVSIGREWMDSGKNRPKMTEEESDADIAADMDANIRGASAGIGIGKSGGDIRERCKEICGNYPNWW